MHIFSARLSRVACDVCVTRDTCDNKAVAHDVMTDSLCHAPLPGHTEWEDTGSYPEISAIWEHQGDTPPGAL